MRPLTSGSITIDGIDITTISRYELRRRISIIPQTPVIYNGTIRQNLVTLEEEDESGENGRKKPSSIHSTPISDDMIWSALKQCHMGEKIRNMENGSGT